MTLVEFLQTYGRFVVIAWCCAWLLGSLVGFLIMHDWKKER